MVFSLQGSLESSNKAQAKEKSCRAEFRVLGFFGGVLGVLDLGVLGVLGV